MSRPELDVVQAVGRALFPVGVFSVDGGNKETSLGLGRILAEVIEPKAVGPFRAMFGALEWGTLVSRGTRLSKLSPEVAQHVLEVWGSENAFPRRVAFEPLEAILGMAFFRRPAVLHGIHSAISIPT